VSFSADGKLLASGSRDTTALVWDLTGKLQRERPAARLSATQLDSLWAHLAGSDAAHAYRAIWSLAAVPQQAVPFLDQRLRPLAPVAAQQLAQLIADLDSDRFTVRQRATEELERLAELAEPVLRKALAGEPSPEMRRRVGRLLQQLGWPVKSPERLRALRAVEGLEHIGTTEARRLLEKLAQGAPEAGLTREAKASLERLAKRPAAKP
jgi:hypothetical protein